MKGTVNLFLSEPHYVFFFFKCLLSYYYNYIFMYLFSFGDTGVKL